MTNKPTAKRKTDYDPARQWGLKPDLKSDGSTYIVSGHIVGASDSKSLFATENMGREGQAKAKRKLDNAEADKLLKQLAARDREGMEAVMKAREVMKGQKEVKAKEEGKGKGKTKATEEVVKDDVQRKAYSTSVVRSIGFDPTVKAGQRRIEATTGESKVSFHLVCH
jgi:minichromosome maintenance protein 10